jgi:hypothetical protein
VSGKSADEESVSVSVSAFAAADSFGLLGGLGDEEDTDSVVLRLRLSGGPGEVGGPGQVAPGAVSGLRLARGAE